MEEILVVCGDIDILRKIVEDLPPKRFTPIASKKGAAIVAKIAQRAIPLAIVHAQLADGDSLGLRQELRRTFPAIKILLLGASEKDAFADVALGYPVPGPVFRNAIKSAYPVKNQGEDMAKWRAFNAELDRILETFKTQNYYQVLGLQEAAPHHALVTIYDQLSARYHPDRYATLEGSKWGETIISKVNSVYQLVVEAYTVLSQRRLRKKYDEGLKRGEIRMSQRAHLDTGPERFSARAKNSQSKKFLKLAEVDIAKKNWNQALQNLRFAQSMEDNPRVDEKIAEIEKKLNP